MATMARNILPVPAASSAVERMFSQMTLQSTGRKSSSNADTIRRKVLMTFNKPYINIKHLCVL